MAVLPEVLGTLENQYSIKKQSQVILDMISSIHIGVFTRLVIGFQKGCVSSSVEYNNYRTNN